MNNLLVFDPRLTQSDIQKLKEKRETDALSLSCEPPVAQDAAKENSNLNDTEDLTEDLEKVKLELEEKPYNPIAFIDSKSRTSTGDDEWDDLINTVLPPRGEFFPQKQKTKEEHAEKTDLSILFNDDTSVISNLTSNSLDSCVSVNPDLENFKWVQFVSKAQASREDLESLKAKLKTQLEHRQARLKGLCSVRADIFDELFLELLRQVLINMPEQGVILSRIHKEAKLKLEAYEMLVTNSFKFGVKSLHEAEKGMHELKAEVDLLTKEEEDLIEKIKTIEDEKEKKKQDVEFQNAAIERAREKELDYLRNHQENLSKFLKQISVEEE